MTERPLRNQESVLIPHLPRLIIFSVGINKGSNLYVIFSVAENLERGELRDERILSKSVLSGVSSSSGKQLVRLFKRSRSPALSHLCFNLHIFQERQSLPGSWAA